MNKHLANINNVLSDKVSNFMEFILKDRNNKEKIRLSEIMTSTLRKIKQGNMIGIGRRLFEMDVQGSPL